MMATKVFISYRRQDAAGHAGRVRDRLATEFGANLLFMDVDGIPAGVNFVKALHKELAKCGVLLAVIGPDWLKVRDKDGKRRLENPNDFVRVEIAAALQRNIPVIPILLDGVKVPKENQLPEDLQELSTRNGFDVRHASFHHDMDRLVQSLKDQLAGTHKVLVYVSSGSTCRDPMAKAITEQLIVGRELKYPVDIYAVGLVPRAKQASYGARQAIKEMYNADLLKDHKPVTFTEELIDKADLILMMDKKLFNATKDRLPQNKTHILKEFFGLSGDVENPYRRRGERDPETLGRYRRCAAELKQILSTHMDTLLNALGAV
jgi:protein-tyrosine-phosphatase